MSEYAPALAGFAVIVLWGVLLFAVIFGGRWLAEQRGRQDREARRWDDLARRRRARLGHDWHERD